MLRNYLKTGWRNLWRNKVFSAINILGLSAGLACCILMFLFIQHELSYDKFNTNASRIYRITSESEGPNGKTNLAVTPAPWAPLLKKDYPEILNYVRLLKDEKSTLGQPGEQRYYENGLLYADSTFFNIFSFDFIKGNGKQALDQPNSIVLTKETARKYFGEADPIGKSLELNSFVGKFTVQVTAIAKEPPSNSHFKFNALVSLQTMGDISGFWAYHMFQSYVLVHDKNAREALEKKFPGFVNKYIADNPRADGKCDIHLQRLTDIHLHSDMVGEIGTNSNITYVYLFSGVALFILLIACFNFTNLSTARSLTRAREVGIKKVAGVKRGQLMKQFLGETVLFAIIALLLAIIIASFVVPILSQLSGRQLSMDITNNYSLLLLFAGLVLFVGFLAGIYPAIVLSSFKPVEVLKGKFQRSAKGIIFRKMLVTLQFIVSFILIAGTLLVTRQMNFLKTKKLGFNRDNVITVSLPGDTDSTKLETFRNTLLNDPMITSVAAASSLPGTNIPINQVNDGNTDLSKALSMQMLFTDRDFIRTMNMKVVAGRDFSKNYSTDATEGFILNQEAVKKMGWQNPAAAIGKTFQWVLPNAVLKKGKVIGVVEDFHFTPLRSSIQPLVMHYVPVRFRYLYARFNQGNAASVIGIIEKDFKDLFAKQSFEYSFLDDTLNNMYAGEKKLARIFSYFSFLAILIACLGILGLSLYSIQQRVREIGIRKVLGASVFSITYGLVKEFLSPVFIAAIIATPLAWFAMHKWLQDFAYRTNIGWALFLITAAIALFIAVLTISFQAIRAAIANPVRSLRSE
jgi:putative ABC transport system permease protein